MLMTDLPHRLVIEPPFRSVTIRPGRPPTSQQMHRVLAMKTRHRHKFIENPFFLISRASPIPTARRSHQLPSHRHAHIPHHHTPQMNSVGSKSHEATPQQQGALLMRQCTVTRLKL